MKSSLGSKYLPAYSHNFSLDGEVNFVNWEHFAEVDKVVTRYTWSGTHQGKFVGMPATDNQVNWAATIIFRITDSKIHKAWYNMEVWGFMQQLGVAPTDR